jgi:hypothetical protein
VVLPGAGLCHFLSSQIFPKLIAVVKSAVHLVLGLGSVHGNELLVLDLRHEVVIFCDASSLD